MSFSYMPSSNIGKYLYIQTVRDFLSDKKVYGQMKQEAEEWKSSFSKSELSSWEGNIKALKDLFKMASKKSVAFMDCLVMIEVCISEDLRADCMIIGKNVKQEAMVVVMELKQWSDDFITKPECEEEIRAGKVTTNYLHDRLRLHPSRQVSDYRWHLSSSPSFQNSEVHHAGMAYCYNCDREMQTYKVLYDKAYDDYIKECKLYTRKTKESLVKSLLSNLQYGCGQEVYDSLNSTSLL